MVKRARTGARLTQTQLAARAGTTQAVIARIEGGKAFPASVDLLDRVARALGGRLTDELNKLSAISSEGLKAAKAEKISGQLFWLTAQR